MKIIIRMRDVANEEVVKNYRAAVEDSAIEIFEDSIVEHVFVKEKKDMDCDAKLLLSERPCKGKYLRDFEDKAASIFAELFSDNDNFKVSAEVNSDAFVESKKTVNRIANTEGGETADGMSKEDRAAQFTPREPKFDFDSVILSDSIKERILHALNVIKYQDLISEQWGLKAIKPNASSALNFYGPSGTGKTMAAEAVASHLGKKILIVSSADMESKFHGESQKNVQALFSAAQRDGAVLFFDEADSFLSRRIGNPSSSSDQSMNQTRSQFLIELENFKGIAIFATNLCSNYDEAFKTRLINVKFEMPDEEGRKKIWFVHTKGKGLNIPFAEDVDTDELAASFDSFAGRDIRNAVYQACCSAAPRGIVTQKDLLSACDNIVNEKAEVEADRQKKAKVDGEIKDLIKNSAKAKFVA